MTVQRRYLGDAGVPLRDAALLAVFLALEEALEDFLTDKSVGMRDAQEEYDYFRAHHQYRNKKDIGFRDLTVRVCQDFRLTLEQTDWVLTEVGCRTLDSHEDKS